MKMGTSLLSNRIYVGNTRVDKCGLEIWTKKTDITEEAIKAVFEYMYNQSEETGGYEISIKGFGKMQFIREEK